MPIKLASFFSIQTFTFLGLLFFILAMYVCRVGAPTSMISLLIRFFFFSTLLLIPLFSGAFFFSTPTTITLKSYPLFFFAPARWRALETHTP